MIPARFDYELAESVDHAVELLGRGDAKLLAGGHSLLPLMKLRFARPSLLVDIGRLRDLAYVREADGGIAIGALTRHHEVATNPLLREACPILAETAALVGDPQVRHRGTIGGSIAHCDPASDFPTVLLVLDAELVARGPDGERTIAAADFFTGFLESALTDQEVLTEIRVPRLPAGTGRAYVKFNRRAQDWATVGVAVIVRRTNGSVDAAVGLTNMGQTPLRARAVEQALAAGEDPARASEAAAEGTAPVSDTNASAEYRSYVAPILVRRALEKALSASG
jgi:aerobic carbon-monoxide dehydrogenase medium subunit